MKNRKWNKALCASAVLYGITAADIIINSLIANKWFHGVPQVHPSVQLGGLTVNTVSVPVASALATAFLVAGVWKKGHPRT